MIKLTKYNSEIYDIAIQQVHDTNEGYSSKQLEK